MPFTKAQLEDSSELRDMAYGWGKIVSRRAYGEEGPGLDVDFDNAGRHDEHVYDGFDDAG